MDNCEKRKRCKEVRRNRFEIDSTDGCVCVVYGRNVGDCLDCAFRYWEGEVEE